MDHSQLLDTHPSVRVFGAFRQFARPRIVATCAGLTLLGCASIGTPGPRIIAALLLVVTWAVHANSINDYSDRAIDSVNLANASDRPLVTHDITDSQFWFVHFFSAVATIALAAVFGWQGIVLVAVLFVVDYIYSLEPIRLTNRTLASPVVLAVAYVYLPFTFGYWSANGTASYPWMLTIGLSLAFLGRILLKDFRDVEGDALYGKRTFLLRYGSSATCLASAMCWIAGGIVITALAYSWSLGLVLAVIVGLGRVMFCLRRLSVATTIAEQQRTVSAIALAANLTILSLFVYMLTLNN